MNEGAIKIISRNRKAYFEYTIDSLYEAGIVLKGTEVKSLRQGKANIDDAFARAEASPDAAGTMPLEVPTLQQAGSLDSSIITEAAPSEMADFSETRIQGGDAANDVFVSRWNAGGTTASGAPPSSTVLPGSSSRLAIFT